MHRPLQAGSALRAMHGIAPTMNMRTVMGVDLVRCASKCEGLVLGCS
jgi:hypothetical protein